MALQFNGINQSLITMNNLGFFGASPVLSFGGWVKFPAGYSISNTFTWMGAGGSALTAGAWAIYSGPAFYFVRWVNDISTPTILSYDTWYHLFFVNDGGNSFIYIDGFSVSSGASSGWSPSENPMYFARGNPTYGYPEVPCTLTDWRFYNRVLSGAEITSIFNGNGEDGVVLGLSDRWRMNEKSPGQVASDPNSVLDIGSLVNHCNPVGSPVYEADPWYSPIPIPTGLTASQGSYADKVSISWDAIIGISPEYQVQRADTIGGSYSDISGWQSDLSFDDITVVINTHYFYKVKARIGIDESDLSSAIEGWSSTPPIISDLEKSYDSKDGFSIGKTAYIMVGDTDPIIAAVQAPRSSLYLYHPISGDGALYVKYGDSAGQWKLVTMS